VTREEERKIIDEMVRLFMEDDDFDVYMRGEQVNCSSLLDESLSTTASVQT